MKRYVTQKTIDAEIRTLYGWKQIELAAYLDVTRGQIAMFETGERSLPSAASLKWLDWIVFTHVGNALENAKAALQLPQPGTQKLQLRIMDIDLETIRLQRKLDAMLVHYQQAVNNIALCQHLLKIVPKNEENEFRRNQVKLSLSISTGTIKKEGLEAQALLKCKIAGLLHEAELCKQEAEALGSSKK